jgi:hypothetical protein
MKYTRDGTIASYVIRRESASSSDELSSGEASLIFLKREGSRLTAFGQIDAIIPAKFDDACGSGCFDWYGNTTTLFSGNRIFGIFGYEVVEAEVKNGNVVEKQRINALQH